ncbi:MAG TPA: hypothetical protein DCQ04_03560 [Actinobacteria bacterium]|nr:hypothetical protein [Actinomycetota bacterium]
MLGITALHPIEMSDIDIDRQDARMRGRCEWPDFRAARPHETIAMMDRHRAARWQGATSRLREHPRADRQIRVRYKALLNCARRIHR